MRGCTPGQIRITIAALPVSGRGTHAIMDLYKAIRELYAEKRRLEEAIASLEDLLGSKGGAANLQLEDLRGKKRRGRKNMPPEERRAVSARMKKYWAQRRATVTKASGRG